MSVVVELDPSLLAEAEHATGLSEPAALVERALKLIIRVEAYRAAASERELELSEEDIIRGQEAPFMTLETYQPRNTGVPQTGEERQKYLSEAFAELEKNETITPKQREVCRMAIELGGSDPTATAAPRRRFW